MPFTTRPTNGPETAAFITTVAAGVMVVIAVVGSLAEVRKTAIAGRQADDLHRLVERYEHLAETTLDAQQRAATDVAELHVRTTAIEKILRSVDE